MKPCLVQRLYQMLDVVQAFQRLRRMQNAKEVHVTKADAVLPGKVRPIVGGSVIVQREPIDDGHAGNARV